VGACWRVGGKTDRIIPILHALFNPLSKGKSYMRGEFVQISTIVLSEQNRYAEFLSEFQNECRECIRFR